ncbi:MAG: superoxide dismutase, Ni [Bacteroidales bacterium]|nr:superoxide dismutase, Ni [Bacteroidales bacterium]
MKKKNIAIVLVMALSLLPLVKVQAHCEIPCGIYEDSLRYELIKEHITTIEKSMKQINELSDADEENYHQIVRWVINKEEHAKKIQDIVSQYFLHQRIKLTGAKDKAKYDKYVKELTLLHELLVYSMKAKQTSDLKYIDSLSKSLEAFASSYFKHDH